MSTQIDRLDIAIEAQAKKAASEVDKLYQSLDKVADALTRTSAGYESSAAGLGKMTSAIKSFSAVKLPNLTKTLVSPVNKVTLSLKNLLGVAIGFYGIRSIFNWGKDAIELASAVTEVQNVVENSFGEEGTKMMEEFSKSAIQTMGMSELATKQIASRYQAMGNAMGITTGQVAEATKNVSKYMGDLYEKSATGMGDCPCDRF